MDVTLCYLSGMKYFSNIIKVGLVTLVFLLLVNGALAQNNKGPGSDEAAPKKSLRVGEVLSLTGMAGVHGDAIRRGVDIAADELRANGWNVELLIEDDHSDTKNTVSAVQLLKARGVTLFIGPTWDFHIAAVRDFFRDGAMLAIPPASSSDITSSGRGLFFLSAKRTYQFEPIKNFLKENKFLRVAILRDRGGWGDVHSRVFTQAAEAAGGAVVGEEFIDYGIDFNTAQIVLGRTLRQKPDIILITASAPDYSMFVKARELMHSTVGILGTDTIVESVANGSIPEVALKRLWVVQLPQATKPFHQEYLKRYKTAAPVYADRGYDALKVYAAAVGEVGSDPKSVRSYLLSKLNLEGASGAISFDSNGDITQNAFEVKSLASPNK